MKGSKAFEITLGIITSVGGFLDVGTIATALQAGAMFGFQLTWALALGTFCIIFLVEMAGRLAAVSHHTLRDAIHERFGLNFSMLLLGTGIVVDFVVLAAEIGGVAIAMQLLTGIAFQWWALPVAATVWLVLWKGSFGVIEKGFSLLGLVTIAFVVSALKLHTPWPQVAAGLWPALPNHDVPQYWFIGVSLIGSLISPYLLYFYSSGALEDGWKEKDLGVNRAVAALGMGFGGAVSLGVMATAAMTLHPQGIHIEHYPQAASMLVPAFGRAGHVLFAASLGIACFGAALEVSLAGAYIVAQSFGWNWGENQRPRNEARFASTYTLLIFSASVLMAIGLDPLKITLFAMALTAVSLPLETVPFLILMNDRTYVREHRNSWFGNTVVLVVVGMAFIMALVAIPLELIGGS